MNRQYTGLEIAVIGMAGRFPGGSDLHSFWDNLKNGVESISALTDEEILGEGESPEFLKDPHYVKANSFIADKQYFDSGFFGIRAREARLMDPQIRIFMETCWKAIEDAGYNIHRNTEKIGLFAGGTSNMPWEMHALLENRAGFVDGLSTNHLSKINFLCSRIAHLFNLQGPSLYIDTACSTSLVAIQRASMSLILRECGLALAGGVTMRNFTKRGYRHQEGMFYSKDGHCRAFDAAATGTVAGEGTGAVLLKRLDDALNDRDNIYAVILGSGINNDGSQKIAYASPGVDGQYKVIRKALQMAGVSPESIGYVETQGTGTLLGDPLEIEALNMALGSSRKKYCAIGSVKTNIGHIDVAAGVAGFIKTVLCLRHKQIVPSLHFNTPNPKIDFAGGPVYVNTRLREWTNDGRPLRAGVSSFGIGGTNVHLILQEPPARPASPSARDSHLLTFSAKTVTALKRNVDNFLSYINEDKDLNLADVAYTMHTGRAEFAFRKSWVCVSREYAIHTLASAAWDVAIPRVPEERSPTLVFVFDSATQEAEDRGPYYELYENEPTFRNAVDDCLKVLTQISGAAIGYEALVRKENEPSAKTTGVLSFLEEYALARLMITWGIRPDVLVSDRAGELVAACIAGVFSLNDALILLKKKESLVVATQERKGSIPPSNAYAGTMTGVVLKLPEIPVISTLTGERISDEEILDPQYWIDRLTFRQESSFRGLPLSDDHEVVLVKIGLGNRLREYVDTHEPSGGSMKMIDPYTRVAEKMGLQFSLLSALGELWEAGITPDWHAFYANESRWKVSLPTYSFDKTEYPVHVDIARIVNGSPEGQAAPDEVAAGRWNVDASLSADLEKIALAGSSMNEDELQQHIVPILRGLWSDFFEREGITPDCDFFEAGGDSLMSLTFINRIEKLFGVAISVRDFFDHPAPASLGKLIASAFKDRHTKGAMHRIPVCERREYYRAGAVQRRMYFLHELDKDSVAYNIPCVIRLEGAIDRERLQAVWRQLIVRHESLRTSFRIIDDEVVQCISDSIDLPIEYITASYDEINATIASFVRPFNLTRSPLLRCCLIAINPQDHILVIDIHHIVIDGTSIPILIRDFIALYKGTELPRVTLCYKDYAAWQQSQRGTSSHHKQKTFWIDEFAGNPGALEIPTDYKRPSRLLFTGSDFRFTLSDAQTCRLKEMAEQEHVTIFMVLLAAFNTLLGKLGGREDVSIGIPAGGRLHADLEEVVGVFVNTLVLRNFPRAEITFRELLTDLKRRVLACFDNQGYQYEELIDDLDIARSAGRNPLFDFMFVFQTMAGTTFALPGLTLRHQDAGNQGVSKFDLTFEVTESEGKIFMRFEYNSHLFKSETIERFAAYYKRIVALVLANPAIRIGDISMLSAQETHQILNVFNATAVEYPSERTIVDLFEDQAEKTPANIALRCGEVAMRYSELNELSGSIAGYLHREAGVLPGDLVGILLERDIYLVPIIMGILKAGAAYVPIDPRFPNERIRSIIADAKIRVLVLRGNPVRPDVGACRLVDLDREMEKIKSGAFTAPHRRAGGKDLAYVIYTSGSTGTPKGVMIEHHALVNRIVWMQGEYKLTGSDVLLQKTPLIFDVSVWELFWWSVAGASLCVLPPRAEGDPRQIIAAIDRYKVTTIHFVPSMLGAFLSVLPGHFGYSRLSSLRWVFASGEALKPEQVSRFRESIYRHCHAQLVNLYGPTEATVDVSYYACRLEKEEQTVPIGKPINNIQLYVLDSSLRLCPVGVSGELCISGAGLSRGYLSNQALTSQKFVDHPYIKGAKLYKTGDLARWLPDGNIEYLGRLDRQVKVRGYRIELGEIETALNTCPGVDESVVVMNEGRAGQYLVAYYRSEAKVPAPGLRAQLAARLPGYMVPDFLAEIDKMPVTINGKLDHSALPAHELRDAAATVKPTNPIQRELVKIWSEVLDLAEDKIGTDTNFFDIGGNSLKIIKLTEYINRRFKVDVSVADTFSYPVIAAFASFLNKEPESVSFSDMEADLQQLNKTITIVRSE